MRLHHSIRATDPEISECAELVRAARAGNREAYERCAELYVPSRLWQPQRPLVGSSYYDGPARGRPRGKP